MLENRRILLLSAYDAASHQQWRHTLCSMFSACQWCCLSLPARYFSWRVRGNSLSWAFNHRRELTDNYDLIIATSLVDLASLRGFVPALASVPSLLYFHENQFAYPGSVRSHDSVDPAMVNLYSALCADQIAFNSEWNRQSFLQGTRTLLNKLPDHVPPGLPQLLQDKSCVLPVPLPDSLFVAEPAHHAHRRDEDDCLQIVWNHRHEYDKGPELLLAIAEELIRRRLRFRLHLLGQRFRQAPAAFAKLASVLQAYYQAHEITPGMNAFVADKAQYHQLLRQSDIVLSTAAHDFQGLSMLEATVLGCFPVAPHALAYPEYLPASALYPVADLSLTQQAQAAADLICGRARELISGCAQPVSHRLQTLSAGNLTETWHKTLRSLVKS